MKLIIITLIILLLVSGVIVYNYFSKPKISEVREYQGPVRPTDNEQYFRKTGITKPLEIKE